MPEPIRSGLPLALIDLAQSPQKPVVVTADLAGPLGLAGLSEYLPDRLVNVGVAEQAMVAIACGIAAAGSRVVAASFASFVLRATEQVRNLLVLDGYDVVLAGSNAGVTAGPNGATHQCVEDVGVMASLDTISVWSPASAHEARIVIRHLVGLGGPHYVRLSRWGPPACPSTAQVQPTVLSWSERPVLLVITHGVATPLTYVALHNHLPQLAQRVRHIHLPNIWPLQSDSIRPLVDVGCKVVTVEDHRINCGLGALLAASSALWDTRPPIQQLGVRELPGSDDPAALLRAVGLSPMAIAASLAESIA